MFSDKSALVSVIVPVFNAEKFLDQCMNSIRTQTYGNLEIICINDGSTDNSLQILQRHAAEDTRIVIVDKKNEGYGIGCNTGIGMARGEWISIVEPDDWIDSTMYQEMLEFAGSFEEQIDVVKTPWTNVNEWNNPEKEYKTKSLLHKRLKTSKRPFTLVEHPVLIEKHPAIWSAIYRKSFLNENDIRFPAYPGAGWADNPFLVETLGSARAIIYLDKAFYNYRADLPFSTINHSTDDAVARPFDRWIDMLHAMQRRGIDDPRIMRAHNLRGFNYINGAVYDDGWDNPIVQAKTREVVSLMDEDLVMSDPKLSRRFKELFYKAQDLPVPEDIPMKGRTAYLIGEGLYSLRAFGPKDAYWRFRNLTKPPTERLSREEIEEQAAKYKKTAGQA